MSINKKHGLGRGLEALLGDDNLDFNIDNIGRKELLENDVTSLNISDLVPSKYQPRKEFNQEGLNALVISIKEKGVLQPLIVRKIGDRYEIIAGERRWRASKIAGLTSIPVIVKKLSNQEVLEVALVENLLRENLSIIEEAEGFHRLIIEFNHTHDILSQIVGKSRSYITNTLRLLSLSDNIQNLLKENKLSAGHAKVLVGLENADEIANKIIDKGFSVRQTEKYVSLLKNKKVSAVSRAMQKDINIKELEKEITNNIGLKVKINAKDENKGKVFIEYKNPNELNTILELLEKGK